MHELVDPEAELFQAQEEKKGKERRNRFAAMEKAHSCLGEGLGDEERGEKRLWQREKSRKRNFQQPVLVYGAPRPLTRRRARLGSVLLNRAGPDFVFSCLLSLSAVRCSHFSCCHALICHIREGECGFFFFFFASPGKRLVS